MRNKPISRRAALAATFAVTPLAPLAPIAGPLAPALPIAPDSPLMLAIERHKAAVAAIAADASVEPPDALVFEEDEAIGELGALPCATDAEFFAKLEYMLAAHRAAHRRHWLSEPAGDILRAIDLHLGAAPDGEGST